MKRTIAIIVILIIIVVLWYLFRPEKLFISETIQEEFPTTVQETTESASSPVVLVTGSFHGVAHDGKGTATIYQLPDGKKVLRFTEFETSNGPDVQVYLVAAEDANDNDTVTNAGFIHIGPLKGNVGDQNYDLPSDVDLSKHKAVTIWCRRFGVNFATAPLKEGASGAASAKMGSTPVALSGGNFHGVAHETKGNATIYQLPDGKRLLRLTNFETSNGPDVHVYLVAAQDANDNDTVKQAGFVELGSLKGNIGDQNYDVPADVVLNKYRAVTIWCQRFGVNFGTAPLTPQQNQGG
ncbi:MAG TPA: DM13 domain-containing protein [Thermodesulfobacteriota bacterium]|nr:DM13 domain-containing protein [Thermodesulfobacteriota bacterium]